MPIYSNKKRFNVFAVVAKHHGQMLVEITFSANYEKGITTSERNVAVETTSAKGPSSEFKKFCRQENLSWETHELAEAIGTQTDMGYASINWYAAALSAGLNPPFYYKEHLAREAVAKIQSGRMAPSRLAWPSHLFPEIPFINPFYEHHNSVRARVENDQPTAENISSNLEFYLQHLYDQPLFVSHLANTNTSNRNLFLPSPKLGPVVTDMERRGKITRVGDFWLEVDVRNRRTAMNLLASQLPELAAQHLTDDQLPPYLHERIAKTIYKNCSRMPDAEGWRLKLQILVDRLLVARPTDKDFDRLDAHLRL